MSRSNTSDIYSQLIIEDIVKSYLVRGVVPTLAEIESDFNARVADQDINSSNFTKEEWQVARKEESSAEKYNSMNTEVSEDLRVLYRSLYENSERAVNLFNRWQVKSNALETRLKALESEMTNLLLVKTDTTGYFNVVGDKFTDTLNLDLDNSTGVVLSLNNNQVYLDLAEGPTELTRVNLNNLTSKQVTFTLLTRTNVINSGSVENTEPRFAFKDINQFWKAIVSTSAPVSNVTIQLDLTLDEPITASKLDIFLHSSTSNSLTSGTPLYSTDGVTYNRFATVNTTAESLDKLSFQFPQTEFKYMRIFFDKKTYDYIDRERFIWEFGAKHIQLYNQTFLTGRSSAGILITTPRFTIDPEDNLVGFNKLSLETCEAVSDETQLYYYLSVAKDEDGTPSWLTKNGFSTEKEIAGEDQRIWFPIVPYNRSQFDFDRVLDLAGITGNEIEDIQISFSGLSSTLISPAGNFSLLEIVDDEVITSNIDATEQRYIFSRPSQRLLDLQISKEADIDLKTMSLWRNVGEKGLSSSNTANLVKHTLAGWEYEEPFYRTTISVKSSAGLTIDTGQSSILINSVLNTGVYTFKPGIHEVRVHKDNWKEVTPELNSVEEIQAADLLYPYNQKLLIEGYLYGSEFPTNEGKVYIGADRFAAQYLTQISSFDFLNNTDPKDLTKFCLDSDIGGTSPVNSSRVIVVNVDTNYADFLNEKYVLEFNLINQLFHYVALKAEFVTENSQLSPILDEYKIKMGF